MDAYHSMYQDQKEETLNEMKLGDVSGSKDFASRNIKGAKGASKPPTPEKTGRSQEEIKKSVDQSIQKGKERSEKRERLQGIMSKYGESVDLLAAYRAVYEHHQKDENGNTIPHEDDVKEGKLNPGLQAFLDKKKGKKKDDDGDEKKDKKDKKDMKEGAGLYANIHAKRKRGGKMRKKGAKGAPSSQDFANAARTAKEDVDMFDTILNHYVNEGYDAEDVIEAMSSLTEEPISMALIGAKLAAGAAKAGAIATKAGAVAAKGGAAAGKALGKVKTIASTAPKKGLAFLAKQGSGTQGLKNVATAYKNPTMGNVSKAAGDVGKGALDLKFKTDLAKSFLPKGDGNQSKIGKRTGVVSASADLFDIVKGQLIDEGLSEEEIRDIMLELTPEEILNEITGKLAMQASKAADLKRAQLAKAGDRAGAADKAAQASRLYKKGAERNLAKQDLSKPLNPQPTNYPKGKGASYQEKPGM